MARESLGAGQYENGRAPEEEWGCPPWTPPPHSKGTIVGRNGTSRSENFVGPFLVHKLLGPRPPPPLCDISSGCGFFTGPFFHSCSAVGRFFLTTAAAGVLCGVVSAVAGPSRWRTGGCAGCCGGRFTVFAAHSPSRSGRPLHVSPRFRVHETHACPRGARGRAHLHGFCGCRAHLHGWCVFLCG